MSRFKAAVKKAAVFLFNPHLLICFGIAWMITNGWSYVLLGLGTLFSSTALISIASGYLAMLWLPFTPEKIITVIIALWLLKLLFPSDTRTLAVLLNLKAKFRLKRAQKKEQDGQ